MVAIESRASRAPRRSDSSTENLADLIAAAGLEIEPATFLAHVEAALRDFARARPVADPSTVLTPSEIRALSAGGFDVSPRRPDEPDPYAATAAKYAALLATSLDVRTAAGRLGVTGSRVRQMLAARQLYGIRLGANWRIPALQFSETPAGRRGLVAGIDVVVAALPEDLHPVAVVNWLTLPSPDLEVAGRSVSPLRWLEAGGDPAQAATIAADL